MENSLYLEKMKSFLGGAFIAGIAFATLGYIQGRVDEKEDILQELSNQKPILAYHSNLDGDEIPDLVLRGLDGSYRGFIGMANGTYVLDENPLGVENYMTHVPGLIELPKFKKRKEKWMRKDNLEGIFGDSPFEGF